MNGNIMTEEQLFIRKQLGLPENATDDDVLEALRLLGAVNKEKEKPVDKKEDGLIVGTLKAMTYPFSDW